MWRDNGDLYGKSCGEGVRSGEVDSHGVRSGHASLTICLMIVVKTLDMGGLWQIMKQRVSHGSFYRASGGF